MSKIEILHTDLSKGAKIIKKELLILACHRLEVVLKHMTLRQGILSSINFNNIKAGAGSGQLAPYKADRKRESTSEIITRELKVFLGACVEEFDPDEYYETAYSQLETQGKAITKHSLVQVMTALIAKELGQNLYMALWSAKRNADGDSTKDLFDGFDTITAAEIATGKISVELGNMIEVDPITQNNAHDTLRRICDEANDLLMEQPGLKCFVSRQIYKDYCYDYEALHESKPTKDELRRVFIDSASGDVELVPLANKTGSKFIHLSTKQNMLIGVDRKSGTEKIDVEKHAAFIVQFIMSMRFGVQFKTIDERMFFVAKIKEV